MTTLRHPRVAPLLADLFAKAKASDQALHDELDRLDPAERAGLLQTGDYRALYARVRDFYLAVSPETATLLYLLARASRAGRIVEFGTSFGLSTLHLAAALRDNGGGLVIGTEFEPAKLRQAQAHLDAAGLADLVELRAGDALDSLSRDLPDRIDLVLLDGAKPLYGPVLDLLQARLAPGAVIVADNADDSPDYLARVRAPTGGYMSIPLAVDVELSLWLGAAA